MVNKKLLAGAAGLGLAAVYLSTKSTKRGMEGKYNGYEIVRKKEYRRPELVFYIPDKMREDCAVIMYPGFGRTPEDYHRAGEMVAEDNMMGVITEWHDDGMFRDEDMLESVYYPADYLRKVVKHPGKIVGVGHSFGAHRLLKAAVADQKERFDGVAAIQPPETLHKYVKNHKILYEGIQMPFLRFLVAEYANWAYPGLHVRHVSDGELLSGFIRHETSLFDFIRDAPEGYSTPTQLIYSPEDEHVDYKDALRAKEELEKKGPALLDEVKLPKLDAILSDKNIETIFKHIKVFNIRVAKGEFVPDKQAAYREALGMEFREKTDVIRPVPDLEFYADETSGFDALNIHMDARPRKA